MKDIHETLKQEQIKTEEGIFVPTEFQSLQKATGGNIDIKPFDLKSFPKPIMYVGYFFITVFILTVLASVIFAIVF